MYQFQSRVSYSEVDENGKLNIPGVINYLQDVTLFHSHDVGKSLDFLADTRRAWLLSCWHIIFKRFPKMGERVTVSTWPYQFKAIYGLRNYTLTTETGEMLAYGEGQWFLFDSDSGKPVRPGEADLRGYEAEEKLDMSYKPRKVAFPEELTFVETIKIYPNQTDTNHHVNNGEYVRISCNYLPRGFNAQELRVEYRTAAYDGDEVYAYIAETEDYYYVLLTDKDKNPYTISEFKKGC